MEDNTEGNSHVRVHLIVGKVDIEIESPEASIERVFDRIVGLIETLPDNAQSVERSGQPDSGSSEMEPEVSVGVAPTPAVASGHEPDQKRGRTRPTAKPEILHSVDLSISAEQTGVFRDFYKEKAPAGQNDQVLTVMYWLSKNLGISILSRNQIFSGLRTVGEKVPKRIQSVISNLVLLQYVVKDGDGYVMHHTGEDHVEKDLPAKDNGTT